MARPVAGPFVALAVAAVACGGAGGAAESEVRSKPDRPPEIVKLRFPLGTVHVDEVVELWAHAVDPDRDPIAWAWEDDCDGSFGSPAEAATGWSKPTPGACTISVTATSNQASDTESFVLAVALPSDAGLVTLSGRFVPQPVVTGISLAGVVTSRWSTDATLPVTVSPGARVAGGLAFDLGTWPGALAASVFDDCAGTVADLVAWASADGAGVGTFSWTAPGEPAVCLVTVRILHEGLADGFAVAVPVGI